MDRINFQKYIYIYYHLNSLCREWYKLKPSFEAKLSTTNPQVKDLLILSLSRLFNRIHVASYGFYLFFNKILTLRKAYQLSFGKHTPKISSSLNVTAGGIMKEITLLQAKFEDDKKLQFKNFPYDFRSRLVALLPPRDCLFFKLAGKTAAKYVENRGQFSDFLLVAGSVNKYRELKTQCSGRPNYEITSPSFFAKSDNWYVKTVLYLNMNSTEKFDRAVKTVSGSYDAVELLGPYTWKHAIYFMNVSKVIMHVYLNDGMLLDAEDFDDFCEAVVQWLKQQKDAVVINIMCPDLTDAFDPQFIDYVKTLTKYNVEFINGGTVIGPRPLNN